MAVAAHAVEGELELVLVANDQDDLFHGEITMSNRRIRLKAIQTLERHGSVTAERLVQAARNPKHPLHGDFEWDDKKASHLYRLDQARAIIAKVRIVMEHKKIAVVGYVRDPRAPAHEQGYVSVARIKDERTLCEEIMMAEVVRAQGALERCREIAAALDLEEEADAALSQALRLKSRIRRGPPTIEDRPSARPT